MAFVPIYYKSESSEKPVEIDISSSKDYVYIRRDIKEVKSQLGAETVSKFVYQEACLTKSEFELYRNILLNKELNDQDNSSDYDNYLKKLETPVEYTNGFSYKPSWADDQYLRLVQQGSLLPEIFPKKIYDVTGTEENAVDMTLDELKALTAFLLDKQEEFFIEYKQARQATLS